MGEGIGADADQMEIFYARNREPFLARLVCRGFSGSGSGCLSLFQIPCLLHCYHLIGSDASVAPSLAMVVDTLDGAVKCRPVWWHCKRDLNRRRTIKYVRTKT